MSKIQDVINIIKQVLLREEQLLYDAVQDEDYEHATYLQGYTGGLQEAVRILAQFKKK